MLDGKPVKVGAILDGPNDYITKALNTFDAPDVPVPAGIISMRHGELFSGIRPIQTGSRFMFRDRC